ncbi:F-BAR and double SH3 domains protein 2-like [Halichondria panicea]|uniref:F-BAR and double SH3 domains protein 2-like n=1 Tax=Halichondria panicea TaxID=6063 RepID=UPI00312B5095
MSTPVKRSVTQNNSTSVRSRLNEQLSRLQVKHNAEVELMEDIKTFTKQRSLLDKQYAESLQRLVSQFSTKREIKTPPVVAGMDRMDNRGVMEVWKMMLDKTGELAKYRLTNSDLLLNKVSEVMKQQRRVKENSFKRLIEIAQKMNSELLDSVKEATTARKSYVEVEKVAEDARAKFSEAEAKLRKKGLKFYESVSGVEKAHKKASDRLKSCQKRTSVNRNDYLLCVETTNAHTKRHSSIDLPEIMTAMDGDFYDKAREVYMFYAQIEADTASMIKAEFEDLRDQSYLVNREYNLQCYLDGSPVLREAIDYVFEPYGQDKVTVLSRDHGAEIFLDKDARKWATMLVKQQNGIAQIDKQVRGLKSVTAAYIKTPEFGTSESFTEAQQNIENLNEEIRQHEVHITKAEARLAVLRGVGVDVAKWLQKAGDSQDKHSDLSSVSSLGLAPSRLSQLSVQDYGSQEFDVETSSGHGQDLDAVSIGSRTSEQAPKLAVALYDYTAQRFDELSIVQDEEIEIVEWDDGDGWCKGRNKAGSEGFLPHSYLQARTSGTSRSSSPHIFNGERGPEKTLASGLLSASPLVKEPAASERQPRVTAIYEYTAQFDEELSFPEGALIDLLRTDDNGIDDGWWEGQYQGRVGVFPSVVVELLSDGCATPPNGIHDATLIAESPSGGSAPPPPDSPPPLPPDYPPPDITMDELSTGSVGPPPIPVDDAYSSMAIDGTPSLTIQNPTPEPEDRYWREDSFEDFEVV